MEHTTKHTTDNNDKQTSQAISYAKVQALLAKHPDMSVTTATEQVAPEVGKQPANVAAKYYAEARRRRNKLHILPDGSMALSSETVSAYGIGPGMRGDIFVHYDADVSRDYMLLGFNPSFGWVELINLPIWFSDAGPARILGLDDWLKRDRPEAEKVLLEEIWNEEWVGTYPLQHVDSSNEEVRRVYDLDEDNTALVLRVDLTKRRRLPGGDVKPLPVTIGDLAKVTAHAVEVRDRLSEQSRSHASDERYSPEEFGHISQVVSDSLYLADHLEQAAAIQAPAKAVFGHLLATFEELLDDKDLPSEFWPDFQALVSALERSLEKVHS